MDSLAQRRRRWIVHSKLQGFPIRIFCENAEIRARAEAFVNSLVGGDNCEQGDAFEVFLYALSDNHDFGGSFGSKAPIQFVNVACFQEGTRLSFQTEDESYVQVDPIAGRAWGRCSDKLLRTQPFVFADLMMAPLLEFLRSRGVFGLHAAAVAKDGRGYLFPGGAGSGKTTVALSLVKQGFDYLADDKVLLRIEADRVSALAFTRSFNIDPSISQHYSELEFLETLEPLPFTTKRAFDISKIYPQTFATCCRPTVIVHLQRTSDANSHILELSPVESFTRIVHQTILSSQRKTAIQQLALLRDLVHGVDSYLLFNASDLYGSPERLSGLVAGL